MSVQAKPSDTAVKLQESGGIKFCPEKRALGHDNILLLQELRKHRVTEVTGRKSFRLIRFISDTFPALQILL